MDLSVVDLSPVPDDGTASDAYANTVAAARQAERLGYTRFWVAEHHGMADTLAGTTPEEQSVAKPRPRTREQPISTNEC